jgi:hypothetical protein
LKGEIIDQGLIANLEVKLGDIVGKSYLPNEDVVFPFPSLTLSSNQALHTAPELR